MFLIVERKDAGRASSFLGSFAVQAIVVLLVFVFGKAVTPKMRTVLNQTTLSYLEPVPPAVKLTVLPRTQPKLDVKPAPIPSPKPIPATPSPTPKPATHPATSEIKVPSTPAPEAETSPAPALVRPVVKIGVFTEQANTELSSVKHAVVAVNAFGSDSAVPTKAQGHSVTSAGFGEETAVKSGKGSANIQSAGFGDGSGSSDAKTGRVTAVPPKIMPVSITGKAIPEYTEEARRLHVEGEVLVEVIFHANGTIQVVRVLKGLGHGLDEAAVRAAARIRFTPSTRDGQPVDVHTTMHIVFQLT